MSYKKSREKTIGEELIETSIYSKDKELCLFDGPDWLRLPNGTSALKNSRIR